MKPVHFVDTTLRDGHMSLWAGAMRTDMMLPVAAQIDKVGFKAMEIISTSFFKKMVRELRDDPWERLRIMARLAPRKLREIGFNRTVDGTRKSLSYSTLVSCLTSYPTRTVYTLRGKFVHKSRRWLR